LECSCSGYDYPYLADIPPVGGPDRGCPSCNVISSVLLNMGVCNTTGSFPRYAISM